MHTIKNGKHHLLPLLSLLLPLSTAWAAGHYPVGAEGIKSATIPGPGQYYRTYNVLYGADDLQGSNGDTLDVDFDLRVFASAHRYIHVTDITLLGGDLFWNFAIPVVYTDIEVGNIGNSKLAVGDLFFEPLGIAWHGDQYDFVAAAAVYLPIGEHGNIADPGKGYYTFMLTGGGTYYFSSAKSWSFSLTARYETHSEEDDTDITPGDDFHIEWGLGKEQGVWSYGISGYALWQVTDDDNDNNPAIEKDHDRTLAIGPEVQRFFPSSKTLVNLKYHHEYNVVDAPEGGKLTFTFTKIF